MQNNQKIRVLAVEPGKEPYVTEISQGLESLQHEVDGYIECVYPYDDPVCIICNEEGKINCMPLNRALKDEEGEVYDIVAGRFLVAGTTDEYFCSLSDELLEKYSKLFREPEIFVKIDGKLHVLPVMEAS